MKNRLSSLNNYLRGHPRLAGLSFWLTLVVCLVCAGLILVHILSNTAQTASGESQDSSRLQWLLTRDGERRGFVLLSDLARDGRRWELWGNGEGLPALAPINDLCPNLRPKEGFGFNGGFWDEFQHPVGVCAGERGIFGAKSHPNGFAIAGGRAWIGPLTARVRLRRLASDRPSSVALELALNPRPLPRHAAYLIDPQAYPGEIRLERPARVAWLERADKAPLRFNSATALKVRRIARSPAGALLKPPPAGGLLLIKPERVRKLISGNSVTSTLARKSDLTELLFAPERMKIGNRWQLELALEPPRGEVRLATCAGPRLLKEGKIVEQFTEGHEVKVERTWRTAVGCDVQGRRLWVVLLARGKDGQPGVTLAETAQTLQELGAGEALNLDGGSSTSVWPAKLGAEVFALFPLQLQIHHALFLRKDLGLP